MKEDLGRLLDDRVEVQVYRDGEVVRTSVGDLAREALDRL